MAKKSHWLILIGLVICVVLLATILSVVLANKKNSFGGGFGTSGFGVAGTSNATSSCGVVSTVIVASSSARQFYYIANATATSESICFNASCTAGTGIQLSASGTTGFTLGPITGFTPQPMYTGPISCIVNSGVTSGSVSLLVNQ